MPTSTTASARTDIRGERTSTKGLLRTQPNESQAQQEQWEPKAPRAKLTYPAEVSSQEGVSLRTKFELLKMDELKIKSRCAGRIERLLKEKLPRAAALQAHSVDHAVGIASAAT